MKTYLLTAALAIAALAAQAQEFAAYFADRTLRIDYLLTGDARSQSICLDELSELPRWAGRRHHLSELPLEGNGQLTMRCAADGRVIYRTSFSSLFLEWLETDEAQAVSRGFEHTVLVPMPRQTADVEIVLFDMHRRPRARLGHRVDPADVLIHRRGTGRLTPHRQLLSSGTADSCIDIAIVAEGYTEAEADTFYADALRACESIFAHEPFASARSRFNVVAVAAPSDDSGVSVPRLGQWRHTAFGSHFSTFYSDRYLTTRQVKRIHNALAGIDYEHIIVLANTDEYGGGGIYNSYTLTAAHHADFGPVVVHEFGHSFGGLADEYFYDDDVMTDSYPTDVEPWEQNISTRVDFASKWADMVPHDVPVPTPAGHPCDVGVFEGGGYSARGVYRPADYCRMRTNAHPGFCAVCRRALGRIIDFYTTQ